MKAITVRQPWSSLIVHGVKDIENRTWACPKKYIGKRVLIHAGASSWIWHRVLNYLTEPMASVFEKLGYNGDWLRNLPTSYIVGSVEIVGCSINHSSIWADKTDRYYGKLIYNWVLANPVLFEKPIPAKGKLSFWESGLSEEDIANQQNAIK